MAMKKHPDTRRCFFEEKIHCFMASVGMGVIYTKTSDGKELRTVSSEHKEVLLTKYYDSYHQLFETAVERKLSEYGKCLIIDGHSFPGEPLPYEFDQDKDRPDICIGTDDYHTPTEIENTVCRYFRNKGYSVELNRPFAGCIVPLKFYRRDPQVMSIMIEINRWIYMDNDMNMMLL